MPYSATPDLLVGDLVLSSALDTTKYIQGAADEMDSKLGFIYLVPVDVGTLPAYQALLLKNINNKLASGRLIMDIAAGGEDRSLHAYGARLVQEANSDLLQIANGTVELDAEKQPITSQNDTGPAVTNSDEFSAVDTFEAFAFNGINTRWQPGSSETWAP